MVSRAVAAESGFGVSLQMRWRRLLMAVSGADWACMWFVVRVISRVSRMILRFFMGVCFVFYEM